MSFKNLKRIIFIFVLFLIVPVLVKAAPAGARHARVETTQGYNAPYG